MSADDVVSDLMDGLRAELPGADDPMILYVLRNSVRDLCSIGRVWKVEGTIPALRNIGALRVSNLSGFGEPVWIETVRFNDRLLYNRPFALGRDKPEAGQPSYWSYQPPDRLLINPILETPEVGDAFHVRAAVQPRLGDDPALVLGHVPAHIYSLYHEAIVSNARGRMLAMPSKPWSNTALAAYYTRLARKAMYDARISSNNERGTQRWPNWVFPSPAAWRRP